MSSDYESDHRFTVTCKSCFSVDQFSIRVVLAAGRSNYVKTVSGCTAREVVGATAQLTATPDTIPALPVSNMKQHCHNMVCKDISDSQSNYNTFSALNIYIKVSWLGPYYLFVFACFFLLLSTNYFLHSS